MNVNGHATSAPVFGTMLRRFRLSAGYSQEVLAERASLSVEAISTLERGTRRAPYAATIALLASALDLSLGDRQMLAAAVHRRRAPRAHQRIALVSLPSPLTRLVGRDSELEFIRNLMAERSTRLLTITGVGGVGKTRFALELARRIAPQFEDGTTFVTLAAIRDPAHVGTALAKCLDRTDDDESPSFQALCARIAARRVLLVVDNFEHVLAGGPLLLEFLRDSPNAVIIATSREALRVTGEHEFVLQPLELETAVELLTERTQAVRPELDVIAQKNSLEAICRRLDGLPLAIELAAARLRHYPVAALLDRLSSRLDVLVSGARDSPPRQRTMRDAIDWSYQLLGALERTVFQIGSLFAGGATLDAFEFLAKSTDLDVIRVDELIASLADKHLITVHEDLGGHIRFEMLETIREYAYEQLVASSELNRHQQAYAEYYAGLAARVAPHLRGPDAQSWFKLIAIEYENIRAALRWAADHDRMLGLRLALKLHFFWSRCGYFAEARAWLEALYDPNDPVLAGADSETRWQVMNLLGLSYHWVGDEERACPIFNVVLEIARHMNDEDLIAKSLNNLGCALHTGGDFLRARVVQEEALAIKQRQGDKWSTATTLSNLGMALRSSHEYQLALARHHEALDLFRSTADRWGEIAELNDIADIYRDQREFVEAARFYKSSLDANVDGIKTLAADSFEGVAATAAGRNRFRQAAVLGGAADTVHRETGRSISTPDRPPFEAACASSRDALGSSSFDEAWSEGVSLPLAEAIEIARAIAGDLANGSRA